MNKSTYKKIKAVAKKEWDMAPTSERCTWKQALKRAKRAWYKLSSIERGKTIWT